MSAPYRRRKPPPRSVMERAERETATFTVETAEEARIVQELVGEGLLLGKVGLDSRGFPVAAGVLGITFKGREWLRDERLRVLRAVVAAFREIALIAVGALLGALASRWFESPAVCASPCRCEAKGNAEGDSDGQKSEGGGFSGFHAPSRTVK